MAEARAVEGRGSILSVEDLSFCYTEQTPVLHEAALAVGPGDVVGLLGANGSGKTTMFGAMTDSIRGIRNGTISLMGSPVWDRRNVGYATQNVGLYASLTVLENLEHAACITLGRKQAKAVASHAIDEFGLGELAHRRSSRLSGGQRRLAHLAAALVHRPKLRLLDEPTTALDFETRNRVVELIAGWSANGDAVVITGHYPEDIEDTCTRVTVLQLGRTTDLGDLSTLLHRQTAALEVSIGSNEQAVVVALDSPTVAGVTGALGDFADDELLRQLTLQRASLRTFLRRDPSLAALVDLAAEPNEESS